MDRVYIVMAESGEYSDFYRSPMCAFETEAEANADAKRRADDYQQRLEAARLEGRSGESGHAALYYARERFVVECVAFGKESV